MLPDVRGSSQRGLKKERKKKKKKKIFELQLYLSAVEEAFL